METSARPKLSIITVNLNNSSGLEQTIASVFAQDYLDYEFIVVDGDSSDGSKRILEKYSNRLAFWVSEKDTGIYNAMNKGVLHAGGEYSLFLNSGDYLSSSDVLSRVFQYDSFSDIIIGSVNIMSDGKIVQSNLSHRHDSISLFSMYLYGLPHQASFIRTSLLRSCPYDEGYRINADWKFFCQKIIMDSVSVGRVPVTVANYDNSGISSVNHQQLAVERQRALEEIVPERVVSDYAKVFPNYYEVYRIRWLLSHRFFYALYRCMTSIGMRLFK